MGGAAWGWLYPASSGGPGALQKMGSACGSTGCLKLALGSGRKVTGSRLSCARPLWLGMESVCWLELLLRVSQELRQDGRQLRGYGSGRAVGPSRAWHLLPRWLHQGLLSQVSALDPSFTSHHFSLCTLFSSNVNLLMVPGIALLCRACGFAHVDPSLTRSCSPRKPFLTPFRFGSTSLFYTNFYCILLTLY